MNIIGGVLLLLGAAFGVWWLYRAFFGTCSYCGSKDIVPDDGPYFYCNDCKRKS